MDRGGLRLASRGEERAWWLLWVAILAAVLVTVIIRVSGAPAWVQLVCLGVGTGLGLLVVELRARRAQDDKIAAVVRGNVASGSEQLPQVGSVEIGDVRVHRALEDVDYVQRDVEPDVERQLRTEQRVLIVGPSMAGTLLALQVAKRLYADYQLLVPKDGKSLHNLLAAGLTGTRLVVWLDDLERYLGSDGLTVQVLDPFHAQGNVLVATIRSAAYEILHPSDDQSPAGEVPGWFGDPVWLRPSLLQVDRSAWRGHWEPRSRGVDLIADDHAWYFTGRERARRVLVGWLGAPADERSRGRVVTGGPGSGKSALLARLVTVSDPVFRRRVPDLDSKLDPSVGAIDVAVHARGKTLREVVQIITSGLGLSAGEPDQLVRNLMQERRPLSIVVDAVDEAAEPREVARWLRKLATQARGRAVGVLVGARPWLLETLGQAGFDVIDLDRPPYLSRSDLHGYMQRVLLGEPGSPYADAPKLAEQVAQAAAHRANTSFLVALLVARSLIRRPEAVDVRVAGWAKRFPADVAEAMDDYLAAFKEDREQVRDLLRPLAYAEGDGLPHTELWAALANALAWCTRYTLDDVTWLRRTTAAAYLIETRHPEHDATGDPTVYRLFHQALVEYLRPQEDERAQQQRVYEVLLATVTGADGRRNWRRASSYVTTHLATHAAAAGQLDELLADVDYLAVADFTRLLPLLPAESPAQTAPPVVLLHQAGARATALPPDRRLSLLALAAAHLGLHDLHRRLAVASPRPLGVRWAHRLGVPHRELTGHTNTVAAVAVGRVGAREVIVSGSDDGTVRIWDAATGTPVGAPLTGHTNTVAAVAVGGSAPGR